MSQSSAASFLADVHVFDRREYAAVVGLAPDDPAVGAMLDRHVMDQEIRHIAENVYGPIPGGLKNPDRYWPQSYPTACKLRPGAVLAYHSALDIHGCAYSVTSSTAYAFAPSGCEEMVIGGSFLFFMDPAPGIILGGKRPGDGIETTSIRGIEVLVTTPERTMADLFDRPTLGGEELAESFESAEDLDGVAMVRHMRALDNPAAAGAMGFWLESRRDLHRVDDAVIEELKSLAPKEPRYGMRAKPGGAHDENMFVEGWNVILPRRFVMPEMIGVYL